MQKFSESAKYNEPVSRATLKISRVRFLAGWIILFLNLFNVHQTVAATTPVVTYGAVLTWDRDTSQGVSGYRIFYGTASGSYTNSITVGNVTTQTILGLAGGVPYFFAVRAYTVTGAESAFSAETRFITGLAKVQGRALSNRQFLLSVAGSITHTYAIQATQDFKNWTNIGTAILGTDNSLNFTDTNAAKFLRRYYRALQTN